MTTAFKPKLFVRVTCPFCIRLENFFEQAGLLEKIEVIECDTKGGDELNRYRTVLSEKLGKQATFPTMEIAPDQFMSDSGALINYYCELYNIEQKPMASNF